MVGRRALTPRRATRSSSSPRPASKAPVTAEILADFLRDLDDPRRAVEIDDRADGDTGRTEPSSRGPSDTKGYTGLEGLLNYVYYQAGSRSTSSTRSATSLHFNLYDVHTGPCGSFSTGRDPETGEPGRPGRGRRHDDRHPRGRPLRRLARPEPARDQRGPRPAAVRPVGLPGRHRARGTPRGRSATPATAPSERRRGGASAAARPRRRRAPARGGGARTARPARRRRRAGADGAEPGDVLDDLPGPAGRRRVDDLLERPARPAARRRSTASATRRLGSAAAAPARLDRERDRGPPRLPVRRADERPRSPFGSLAASPTMVGAVTTLIVIVAVFLAYNANSGLPFVPVYRVSVEVPERRPADQQQRGPDRRRTGSASSSRSTPIAAPQARRPRRRRPDSEAGRRPPAARSRGST